MLRSLVVGYHDLLGRKVAVSVRLQLEIRRSISLHVHHLAKGQSATVSTTYDVDPADVDPALGAVGP
jgi:hypothetical protein